MVAEAERKKPKKKPFEFSPVAKEVMLEHLPPRGTGSRADENQVLAALSLYEAIKDALHEAWAAGRDIEKRLGGEDGDF